MMKRIFITGGTGFFGKSMLDYRLNHPEWAHSKYEWVILSRSPDRFIAGYPKLANQHGVSFISGDVRNFIFPDGTFDAIIHAATSVEAAMSDNELNSVMEQGVERVAEFAKTSGCNKVLFTSSGAVYGPRTTPASEDDACNPTTVYGKGKLAAEKFLIDSGLDVKIARCFAFVGPYLPRTIHFAIGNFIQDCIDGKDIVIKGDGTPIRSYLYADDLVEWLFAILERGESGRPYNVGSDKWLSIKAVAEAVCSALGSGCEIVVKGRPSGGPPSVYVPNISRAREELGLCVSVPLIDAIRSSR